MKVTVTGGTLSQQEQDAYIARAYRKYPHNQLESLEIHVDGDYVDLSYTLQPQKFGLRLRPAASLIQPGSPECRICCRFQCSCSRLGLRR